MPSQWRLGFKIRILEGHKHSYHSSDREEKWMRRMGWGAGGGGRERGRLNMRMNNVYMGYGLGDWMADQEAYQMWGCFTPFQKHLIHVLHHGWLHVVFHFLSADFFIGYKFLCVQAADIDSGCIVSSGHLPQDAVAPGCSSSSHLPSSDQSPQDSYSWKVIWLVQLGPRAKQRWRTLIGRPIEATDTGIHKGKSKCFYHSRQDTKGW